MLKLWRKEECPTGGLALPQRALCFCLLRRSSRGITTLGDVVRPEVLPCRISFAIQKISILLLHKLPRSIKRIRWKWGRSNREGQGVHDRASVLKSKVITAG